MKKEDILYWLDYVRADVEDNWDKEEYSKEINNVVEALEYAQQLIESDKVVGSLTIKDKTYIVSK